MHTLTSLEDLWVCAGGNEGCASARAHAKGDDARVQLNDNHVASLGDIVPELAPLPALTTLCVHSAATRARVRSDHGTRARARYLERNPVAAGDQAAYRAALRSALPSLTQIDATECT